MYPYSLHILRVGMGVTFLWIGVLIFRDPEAWGVYLQPWAAGILTFELSQAMIGTALLDIAIGFLLLVDAYIWLAAGLASLHLAVVLAVSGINAITVRDIGLLGGTLALFISSLPERYQFWRKKVVYPR